MLSPAKWSNKHRLDSYSESSRCHTSWCAPCSCASSLCAAALASKSVACTRRKTSNHACSSSKCRPLDSSCRTKSRNSECSQTSSWRGMWRQRPMQKRRAITSASPPKMAARDTPLGDTEPRNCRNSASTLEGDNWLNKLAS